MSACESFCLIFKNFQQEVFQFFKQLSFCLSFGLSVFLSVCPFFFLSLFLLFSLYLSLSVVQAQLKAVTVRTTLWDGRRRRRKQRLILTRTVTWGQRRVRAYTSIHSLLIIIILLLFILFHLHDANTKCTNTSLKTIVLLPNLCINTDSWF